MKPLIASLVLASMVAFAASPADAQVAFAAKDVHLRAGPGRDYPVVAVLYAQTALDVRGCLSDYRWCDVVGGGQRGWVYAANISYAYQGGYVPVLPYGRDIGIAVTVFVLFDYWGYHYRDRPWYPERNRWVHPPRHHPLPPRVGRPLPPPPVHGGPGRHPGPPGHGGPGEGRPLPPQQPPPHDRRAPPPPPRGSPAER